MSKRSQNHIIFAKLTNIEIKTVNIMYNIDIPCDSHNLILVCFLTLKYLLVHLVNC